MDELATFGLLMGLEVESKNGAAACDESKSALLVFCPTADLGEGKISVTPRMMDLSLMGFRHVAIVRWCTDGNDVYVIFATENLSEALRNAVLEDVGNIVRKAIEDFEL